MNTSILETIMESTKVFENLSLSTHRNNKLNEYRKIGKYTDLRLRSTDGKTISVHKNILTASCPYFEKFLNYDMVTTGLEIIQLVDNVTINDLEIIIEYIYTGKVEISIENAENLYIKTQYFHLLELQNFCSEFLIENIQIENCLEYWRNSIKYLNNSLAVECLTFIRINCITFLKNNAQSITAEELRIILSEELYEIDQEDLYEQVAQWIKDDFEKRNVYLMELIRHIDFSEMSDDFIETKIMTDKILQNNQEFLTKIIGITFENLKIIKKEFYAQSNQKLICMGCVNKKRPKNINLITNGGIYKLNWTEWAWEKQFNFENRILKYFATANFKDDIYITGGWNHEPQKQCTIFNTSSQKIKHLPQMIENRCEHKSVYFKDSIYCCGGENNKGSVEMFNHVIDGWTKCPSMNEHKSYFGLITSNNSLYAIGGWKSETLRSNVVEQFDVREGKWRIISSDTPTSSQTVVLSNNSVYCFDNIFGGNLFDLRTNTWTNTLADVFDGKEELDYYAYCSDIINFNDEIFGVFQTDDSKTWGTYKYDYNIDKWANLNIPLNLFDKDDIRLCVTSEESQLNI